MSDSSMLEGKRQFTPRAVLAAIGIKLRQLGLFAPVQERVKIGQKAVKDTPVQKLYDGLVAILAGAHGLVEINKRLRSDRGLQTAFGRDRCAEQSVVQDTLDACTAANVAQLQEAVDEIYRRHSTGYHPAYAATWQLLDVDMTGLPCGKKAAFATKGYFANQRNRRGRQLGRVLASWYDEIVVDRVFNGTTQLRTAFRPLVEAAERTLTLDEAQRARTILRIDAGGGTDEDVNWTLQRGYQIHGKDYSGQRAQKLAQSVTMWIADPRVPDRQVGWVTAESTSYTRPLQRIAVRCQKRNGQWGVGILLSTLSAQDVILLTQQPIDRVHDPQAVLLAYVYLYDQRGGGIETANRADKQGLGLTKRNKKRFEAQQMLAQLGALAHNVIVWARAWLAPYFPRVAHLGILCMVRDVFQVYGFLLSDDAGQICSIVLNQADPLAPGLARALTALLEPHHVATISGQI